MIYIYTHIQRLKPPQPGHLATTSAAFSAQYSAVSSVFPSGSWRRPSMLRLLAVTLAALAAADELELAFEA
eukprot:s1660_g5.t1